MQASELEKKNLETHVELCAERYKFLEEKLENVEDKVTGLEVVVREVHDMIQQMAQRRNDQLIRWGVTMIGSLVVTVAFLLVTYVFPS